MKVKLIAVIAASVALYATLNSVAFAQHEHHDESHSHQAQRVGPHGGTMHTAGKIQTETVVTPGGIKVYLFGLDGKPLSPADARGVASLAVEGNPKRYRYDLFPGDDGSLSLSINLSTVAGHQLTVDYQIVGVAAAGATVNYRDVVVGPVDPALVEATAIARQKVCPVSGKALGSMGKPIAVDLEGQRVFVCCAGCVDTVKANPAKFLKGGLEVKVVEATAGDAKLIAAQKTCPVMDESLGSMGQPVKLMVGETPMFLCCKGCIKKVEANPELYLAKIAEGVTKGDAVRPGVFKVSKADAPYIKAQDRCPVMDEPLHAMGGPFMVNAKGKAIYICCPGCAKKIAAEPDKYLAVLKAKGVEPPAVR